MNKNKITFIAILCMIVSLIVLSCSLGKTPKIAVKSPRLMPSGMMKGAASAFMLIVNNGNGSDKLTGCSIKEFPSVRGELHDVIGGKMKKLEEIKIPANEITVLKRGSLHLMFFSLPEKLEDEVTLILKFKRSGSIEVRVKTLH